MNKNLLTAIDIDTNQKSIAKQIEENVNVFNKSRLDNQIKEIRNRLKKQFPDNESKQIVSKDEENKIRQTLINDDESKRFRERQKEILLTSKDNHYILRKTIQGLNELNEFSAEIERNDIQKIDNFLFYEKVIEQSLEKTSLFQSILKIRKDSISEHISKYVNKKLPFNTDSLRLLLNMRDIYKIDKNVDDIDLYEKYEMESNIDMSHKLSDIYFSKFANNDISGNIINEFAQKNNLVARLAKSSIINNKLLAILLGNQFISNNSVTCMKNMYVNNLNNDMIYCTRTLGELLFEIVNEDNKETDKQYKQQIYTTYDGTRPTVDEYYKWNGLQVFDIDLKEWDGNIEILKNKMFEYLQEFNWFLWICKSASGRGIHIYTKVTPPHHVYINIKENEYIAKYWFKVSYESKLSIVYDIIYRLNKDSRSGINFPNNFFSENSNNFELTNKIFVDNEPKLVGVDNTVGRITSGIRLTYDENILINQNFVDLHVGLNLAQTLDGFNYIETVERVFFRDTPVAKKHINIINNDLTIVSLDDIHKKDENKINLADFVFMGVDINDVKKIPRSSINYQLRYNVCNTLAALFGKDGLPIAHTLLDSTGCKNVGEINSFYSCAISNGKLPSKYGVDILKKCGIIKDVKPELDVIVGSNFKKHIRKIILNSLNNKIVKSRIELNRNEYISDKKVLICDANAGGITNQKINIIFSPPGTGKCLGKNTPILMFDGSIKMVQDIVVGDKLMGLDSKPRNVLSLARGREEMFNVIPNKGEIWSCNKSHILSVIESGKYNSTFGKIPNQYDIEDLNISQIKNLPINHRKKLFRVPLNFDKKDISLNPYFLGLWLGDGHSSRTSIAVGDVDKIVTLQFLSAYAKQLDCKLTEYKDFRDGHNVSEYSIVKQFAGNEKSTLQILMDNYNLFNNKYIPKDFLLTDRKTRLLVFAGLIDSDGGGTAEDGTYDYVTKFDSLKNDICFLARSLGYNVNCKTKIVKGKSYWRLLISGDFSDVPVRLSRKKFIRKINKNPLVFGFKIESIGIGDYYGFEIDGDKRFMLGDFTVTHNTEFIKTLAKDGKRILLVLPYISVIKNKIETDPEIMDMFECYYGTKDIKLIDYGINAVTTFDKFAKSNYEKISRMFDYIFIDESHLLFTSAYRIEATSNVVKKIKELFFISSNDPFAAKLCLLTGTETGESYFFGNVANIIRINKKSLDKTMDFLICDDTLDATTRLVNSVFELLTQEYKILIPTNKGEIYAEKLIGMIEYLLGRPVKYGYYKRSNTEQEICRLINDDNTVGDYEIIFCSNYLSVGVDINDKDKKFASIYFGPFSGYEVEQFNARIRKTDMRSIYCIQTEKSDGTTNDLLLEEPNLLLRITEEDKENFLDDKMIAGAKQEFLAQYDPVLHKVTTPGFSYINGKIRFNLEEYELTSFENKYNECMQHPVKVARELDKYGYNISVNTEFDGLDLVQQQELKKIGMESAREEKIKKHTLLVGTYNELILKNTYINEHGLEFTDIIGWIGKHPDIVVENRLLDEFIKITFDVFATPLVVEVKSREALDTMYKHAKYLISKYSITKCLDIINQYVDDAGILKMKNFKRAINLLKLIDSSDNNELAIPMTKILEKIYDFIDDFEKHKDYKISYDNYQAILNEWTTSYIDMLGIKVKTEYAFLKLKDQIVEMLNDIATKHTSKAGLKFTYNKMVDQDSASVINRRSVDNMIQNMFQITSNINETNTVRNKHILQIETKKQDF